MKVVPTTLPKVLILESEIKKDQRGWFTEAYNRQEFRLATELDISWRQDNRFMSLPGVLRGPHFYPTWRRQYKLTECITGRLFVVAICVDPTSKHFGKHAWAYLFGGDGRKMLVPPGYAHAVLALEESIGQYKTSVYGNTEGQMTFAWDDPDVGVLWPIHDQIITSGTKGLSLKEIASDSNIDSISASGRRRNSAWRHDPQVEEG